MIRLIYRAQCYDIKKSHIFIKNRQPSLEKQIELGKLMAYSVFSYRDQLFLYYECVDNFISPEKLFDNPQECLEAWPGDDAKRHWAPMEDIFHYNTPAGIEHWRRKSPVERSCGRIAKLKPDMVSSYIYYHYLHQEEHPGRGDKYGIIGINENLLFFYQEIPYVVETPLLEGKLKTDICPENWSEVMEPHFIKWGDVEREQEIWRDTETVISHF